MNLFAFTGNRVEAIISNWLLHAELGKIRMKVLSDAGFGNGEKFAFSGKNAFGERAVSVVVIGGRNGMKQRHFFRKTLAVMDDFPATGEALDATKRLEAQHIGPQHFVGRFGVKRQPQCVVSVP